MAQFPSPYTRRELEENFKKIASYLLENMYLMPAQKRELEADLFNLKSMPSWRLACRTGYFYAFIEKLVHEAREFGYYNIVDRISNDSFLFFREQDYVNG